jgi:hypothetical protein
MRTRKPAAAAAHGDSCHRCTALLLADTPTCSLCGWPVGVGYPPAEGEFASPSEEATEASVDSDDETAEQTDAQLDALAGMAEPVAEPVAGPVAEAVVEPEAEPADDLVDAGTDVGADVGADDGDADALTAPLTPLAADTDAGPDTVVGTPIDVAAEAAAASEADVVDQASVNEPTPDPDAPTAVVKAAAPGRAASLARPVQALVIAASVLGLLVAGLRAAFGAPVDSSVALAALALSVLQVAVWAAATVTFLYWVSRAYENVATTAAFEQRQGPTVALVGWVIPVVGLFIGYRVLQDLWTGSDPATRQREDAKPSGARLIDVWLLGLVTALLFGIVAPFALGASALWSGVAAIGVLASGLSLAMVVGAISRWQDQPDAVAPAESESVVDGTVTTRVDDMQAGPTGADTDESVSALAE